jgi:hypothetical protein
LLPKALVGEPHLGGYVCEEWELRVTARCLEDDLGAAADASFEDISGLEIIKTFVRDRSSRTNDTRQVSPLVSGKTVWVLARGNDHRGGTWFDETHHVVWLLAYRLHRSNTSDDFFPYAKELDHLGELLPVEADYKRLFEDHDQRFAAAVRIEGPLILKHAREKGGEQRISLGGAYGACIALEVAEGLEQTTVAFLVDTVPYSYVPIILAALHADGDWEPATAMPSRELEPGEFAFTHLHERA